MEQPGCRGWCFPPAACAAISAASPPSRTSISTSIRRSIHALIGPNGAGKTTVFNLLTKFLPPTAGRSFLGEDITAAPPAKVARMGLVRSFQISAVFPHLTVLENVRVALQRPHGSATSSSGARCRRSTRLTRAPSSCSRPSGFRRRARPDRRRSLLRPQARARDRDDAGARSEGAAARRADGRHGPRGCRRGLRASSARSPATAPC